MFIRRFGIFLLRVNNSRDFLQSKRFVKANPFAKFTKVLPCETYPPYGTFQYTEQLGECELLYCISGNIGNH